jgi:hypothetical protein
MIHSTVFYFFIFLSYTNHELRHRITMGLTQSSTKQQPQPITQPQPVCRCKHDTEHMSHNPKKRKHGQKQRETFISYTDVLNRNAMDASESVSSLEETQPSLHAPMVSGMALPGGVYGVTDGVDPLSSYRNICDHCEDTIIRTKHNRPQFTPSSPGVYPHPDTSLQHASICETQSVSNTCTLTNNR